MKKLTFSLSDEFKADVSVYIDTLRQNPYLLDIDQQFARDLFRALDIIESQPLSHPIFSDYRGGLRRFVLKRYRKLIIYTLTDREILILRLVDSSLDLSSYDLTR